MPYCLDEIQKLDQEGVQEQELPLFHGRTTESKADQRETQANDNVPFCSLIMSRSMKKKGPEFDISFENNFMLEHASTFAKQFQNHMEFIKNVRQKQNLSLNHPLPEVNLEPHFNSSLSALLTSNPERISPTIAAQFLKDLEHQEKLEEFLNMVVASCQEKLALEMLILANEAWEKFTAFQQVEPSFSELLSITEEQVEREALQFFESPKFSILNLRFLGNISKEDLDSGFESFKKFLKYFKTTVWLVTAQYFENPYFEREEDDGSDGLENVRRSYYDRELDDDFSIDQDSLEDFRLSSYKRFKE